jgi:hypothetical protein
MFGWLDRTAPEVKIVEKVVYKVIAVKSPRTAQKWTKEIKDAVATLPSHPGFVAIQDRINLQKQMLEHKCSAEFHKDLRESDFIQAGYLQRLTDEATQLPRLAPVDAYEEEIEAFKQIDATIERIGMESQAPETN